MYKRWSKYHPRDMKRETHCTWIRIKSTFFTKYYISKALQSMENHLHDTLYASINYKYNVILQMTQILSINPSYFYYIFWKLATFQPCLNPIPTGLFESKFQLGWGLIWPPPPPSDLGPEAANCRAILHGCQDTCKKYRDAHFSAENGLFNIL